MIKAKMIHKVMLKTTKLVKLFKLKEKVQEKKSR